MNAVAEINVLRHAIPNDRGYFAEWKLSNFE